MDGYAPVAITLPTPEPSLGWAAYDAEKRARLRAYYKCLENYGIYIKAKAAGSYKVEYRPIKLDIENVSRCNLACRMCAVSTWKKGKRAEDMTLEQFKHIIDTEYGLIEIKLNGLGEALMQGDQYFEMIKYARLQRIWVRMTTNASLLHVKGNYKKLIDSGVNEIDISVDGATAKTYEKIRVNGDFEQVAENCRTLNAYAKEQGRHCTKMWTLVQRDNATHLEDHVGLAAELGFRNLVFSMALHGWGNPQLEKRNKEVERSGALDDMRAHQLIIAGSAVGVKVSFWQVDKKFESGNRNTVCPWPFERAVITSDLRTVPCCMIGDPDQFELGKGKSFEETWTGGEYEKFRRAHEKGNVPASCRACYKAPA